MKLRHVAILLGVVFVGCVLWVIVIAVSWSGTGSEATRRTEELFAQQFTKCGDSYYGKQLGSLFEYREVVFSVKEGVLTEADRKNGTEWKGYGSAKSRMMRFYDLSERKWSEWRSGSIMTGNDGTIAGYQMEKRGGKWLQNSLFFDANITGSSTAKNLTCEQIPK